MASLFLPAGTFRYWQAWGFLAVFSVAVLGITLYLMQKSPELLQRRVNAGPGAETNPQQKVIQSLASLFFLALFVVSSLDHRLGLSTVPPSVCLIGDVLVAAGLLLVFFVFRENAYASATIEVGTEQRVVSTGPYAWVRHPMYLGAIVMLIGVPVSLGSWWALLTVLPMIATIVWRLLEEERFLLQKLPGYSAYRAKVKSRMLPFLW